MRRFRNYLLAGTFFSTVEEFLTVVLLKGDVPSYIFTLIILFPVFLTGVFFLGDFVDRVLAGRWHRDLVCFLLFGFLGLMIEWFAIGLSPWSNPDASPALMALFQLGMFSFWATVAFAPRVFVRGDRVSAQTRRWILRFYVPYFLVVYVVLLLLSGSTRFAVTIVLIILGYYVVAGALLRYAIRSAVSPSPRHQCDSGLGSTG